MVKRGGNEPSQEFGSAGTSVIGDAPDVTITERDDEGNSNNLNPSEIDANAGAGQNGDGSEPVKGSGGKRRGRKPGWKKQTAGSGTEKTTAPLDIASLNSLIYNGHMLLAKAAKIPELQLDEDEAKKLADATANVARHYNIHVSQKTLDWSNFVTALSTIYGTRIFVIAKNKQDQKKGAQQSQETPSTPSKPIITPLSTTPYQDAAARIRAGL